MSWSEWGVIAIVLIIFLKPEDWPNFLRKMGRLYGQLRKMMRDFEDHVKVFSYDDEENHPPQ